jgi:endonuclease G, mitochondrial
MISVLALTSCQTLQNETSEKITSNEIILDKKFFIVSYNLKYKIANSVSYTLKASNLKIKIANRKNHFYKDPDLLSRGLASTKPLDFYNTKYDKGHLAPSGDFLYSQEANDATFVMSNIAPQTKNLNRKAWRYLEDHVRKWACTEKELKIITGAVIDSDQIKPADEIFIPNSFYKVILDNTPPRKAIAFVYLQTDEDDVYIKRSMSLDKIETILGRKFFTDLTEHEEIKNSANILDWKDSDCT